MKWNSSAAPPPASSTKYPASTGWSMMSPQNLPAPLNGSEGRPAGWPEKRSGGPFLVPNARRAMLEGQEWVRTPGQLCSRAKSGCERPDSYAGRAGTGAKARDQPAGARQKNSPPARGRIKPAGVRQKNNPPARGVKIFPLQSVLILVYANIKKCPGGLCNHT